MGLWSAMLGAAIAGTNVVQPGDDLAGYTNGLLPGDVIQFSDGEYTLETGLDWTSPGTPDQPIVFEAAPGAKPVLRAAEGDYVADLLETEWVEVRGLTFAGPPGASEENWLGGLRTYRSNHIVIEDCQFESLPGIAVRIDGDASDITLTNSAFRDLPWRTAIEVGCWDASCWLQGGNIEGNWIHGLAGEYGYAIYLHHGTQGVEVHDNVITDVAYRALYAGSTEYGEPNLIEGNAIWDIGDHGLWLEGAARVRNNVIASTGGEGIRTYRAERGGLDDLVIAWNTISNTGSWAIYLDHWSQAAGMVLASNAVGNPVGYGLWYTPPDEGATTDNRLVANVITGAVEGLDPSASPMP